VACTFLTLARLLAGLPLLLYLRAQMSLAAFRQASASAAGGPPSRTVPADSPWQMAGGASVKFKLRKLQVGTERMPFALDAARCLPGDINSLSHTARLQPLFSSLFFPRPACTRATTAWNANTENTHRSFEGTPIQGG